MSKLNKIRIENFRIHKVYELDNINDLKVLVGKNDAGKSSILDALNVFFNNPKVDVSDFNIPVASTDEIKITCTFEEGSIFNKIISQQGQVSSNFNVAVKPEYFLFGTDNFIDKRISKITIEQLIKRINTKAKDTIGVLYKYRVYIRKGLSFIDLGSSTDSYVNIEDYIQKNIDAIVDSSGIEAIIDAMDSIAKIEAFVGSLTEDNKLKQWFEDFVSSKDLKRINKRDIISSDDPELSSTIAKVNKVANKGIISFTLESGLADIKLPFQSLGNEEVIMPDNTTRKLSSLFSINNISNWANIVSLKNAIIETLKKYVEKEIVKDIFYQWEFLLREFYNCNEDILIGKRGSGVRRICSLYSRSLSFLCKQAQSENIFAIDEPEISLHPNHQRLIAEQIKAISTIDNIQLLVCTHSPIVVKVFGDNVDNIKVLKKDSAGLIKNNPMQERCIKMKDDNGNDTGYISLNEINYIAFDEPSIEYHIELFGWMHNQLIKEYKKSTNARSFQYNWRNRYYFEVNKDKQSGNPIGSKRRPKFNNLEAVDIWLNLDSNSNNNLRTFVDPIDNSTNILAPKTYEWYDTREDREFKQPELHTLPYCIRNYIDHPTPLNKKYDDYILRKRSIEIMRNAIILNIDNVFN